jgi:glycosyltransferase involved in cell wall biosynthesis
MAIQAEKLAQLLGRADYRVIRVNTNALGGPLRAVPWVRSLCNLGLFLHRLHWALKRSDAVVLLSGFFNFFFWVTYPALGCIRLHRKPVVLSARGGNAGLFFKRYGPLVAPILRRVDRITTPSEFLRDVFVQALALEPVVVPNIADLDQFAFVDRPVFRPRLLFTRNLEAMYDPETVLRAFDRVRRTFPEARLGVAGEGSQRGRLDRLVRELQLDGAVTFYGRVDHDRIQELYASHDIYINASRVDNLPGAILEAFACGLPVISTRAGGIPYLVRDGVSGLLVEPGDVEGLARAAIRVVRDPALGRRLAAAGRQEISRYAPDNVAPLLRSLLEQAMGRNGGRKPDGGRR